MSKEKNREFMNDEELIQDFNKRYSNKPRWLEVIANDNNYYVDKFILGKLKNPFYKQGNSFIKKGDKEYYALTDWIIPNKKYQYIHNITWKEFCNDKNVVRSSIIPVVKINDENYWILGSFKDYQETENPILIGFGGQCEKKDKKRGCPAINLSLIHI